MPSIANRKRNANQNHSEVSPHAHENGHRHKNRTLVRTWRSPVRRSWKAVWRSPPPNQHQDHCDTAVPLLGIRPKEFRAGSQREVCTAALAAALVTVSEARKQPARPFAGGRRMWHTRKATHRAALKKERSCRISDADEPRGRHTNEMSSPGLRREDKPVRLDAQEGSRAVGVTETGRGGGCRGPRAGRGHVRVCGVRRQFRKTEKQTCCTKCDRLTATELYTSQRKVVNQQSIFFLHKK